MGLYGNPTLNALAALSNTSGQSSVNTQDDLSNTAPIDTLIYVKSTTSFWQKTSNGWIDTEADVKNQDTTLLTPLEI